MDIQKIKNIVAAAEDACVDYPFEDDFETAVLRRASSRKWFGVYIAVPKKYFRCSFFTWNTLRSVNPKKRVRPSRPPRFRTMTMV